MAGGGAGRPGSEAASTDPGRPANADVGAVERGSAQLARWTLAHPGLVLGAWALAAALATAGVSRLEFATAPSTFLDRLSPEWAFYQQSVERFGGDEVVVVALQADSPWAPESLADVLRVTRELEGIPGVRRVDSLATVPIVRGQPDGALQLDPALRSLPTAPDARARAVDEIREAVAGDRLVPRSLVSSDGRTFAVNVVLEADADREQGAVVEAAYRTLEGRAGWVSGVPVYEYEVGRSTEEEVLTFVPVTLLLMGTLLWLVFRSLVAVVVPLLASGLGTWLMLGTMGALGEPITMTAMILPSVLLAVGCAYVMHVLVSARGLGEPAALARAVAEVTPPIVLSGLTTAVGFFAIATIRIDALRALGAFGGIGVLLVLLASLTVAPALLRWFPLPARGAALDAWIRRRLGPALLGVVQRRRAVVILVWVGVLLASTFGIARLHVETDAVRWWPPGSPMREHYEAIRERLSGISPMNVVIETSGGRRVIEPDVLSRIDALSSHLAGHPDVGRVVSIVDPLRQLHGGFSGDPGQPLPDREELAAQYLLLLDSVEALGDVVSPDQRAANVLLRVDENGSRHLLDVARAAETWWHEHGAPDFEARATGIMFEFARSQEEIAWGQIRGFSLDLLVIGAILLLIFRTPRVGGLALLPNLASLALIYGLMGLLDVPLDGGTVCMGTLALGIAVDDTIHTLSGYRRSRLAGAGSRAALAATFDHVLPAVIYTSVVIAAGFAVLGLSEFMLTSNLGLVTTVVVAISLVANTTLLPAVLLGEADRPS